MNQELKESSSKNKKKLSVRKEESMNNFLMKRFTDIDAFNRTVDASVGTILDLCYKKNLFTVEEFEKHVTNSMKIQTFQKIMIDCTKIADKEKIVERIIHGMINLDIDKDHDLLKIKGMRHIFGDKAEAILQLLDEKLKKLIEGEEDNINGKTDLP